MLRFIFGRSGSGKTETVFRELRERATAGTAPLVLLVPEQASFESERRLLLTFGPVLSQRVQVLSFTRLAATVFREIGGLGGKRMDTTLSLLLLNQALHDTADVLTVYDHSAEDIDYVNAAWQMVRECKQCALTPERLEQLSADLPEGLLRKKIGDIARITAAYDALVAQASLIDPQDDLTVLATRFSETALLDGAQIYIDGFKGFTGQELAVLEELLPRAAEVTVTLCAEGGVLAAEDYLDRFSTAARTARQLRDCAYRRQVRVAAPVILTENRRTADAALAALEAGCFVPGAVPYPEATEAVAIMSCADVSEECRAVACYIRRRLRTEGGFARDFTVVMRDSATYGDRMEQALAAEGIPCCRDAREPVLTQPLTVLCESVLAAVLHRFRSTDVLRLAQTGLTGLSPRSVSDLENYVYYRRIEGDDWCHPFTANPDRLSAELSPTAERHLARLERLRRRLIEPLTAFAEATREPVTGEQFARALFAVLTTWNVPRSVRVQVARLEAAGEYASADTAARLWDYTVQLLDTVSAVLHERALPLKRLAELVHLAVASDDLGSLPQGLDGVILGNADRIRYTAPRTVVVLGANEGVFPAYPSAGGLLTDRERRTLLSHDIPFGDDAERTAAEERFFAYMAVSAPRERLLITYARKRGAAEAEKSSLVIAAEQLLPRAAHPQPFSHDGTDSESPHSAFAELAALWQTGGAVAAGYRAALEELPDYAGRIAALDRQGAAAVLQDGEIARRLYGEAFSLSASSVEDYYRCAFKFFCRYGLHLTPLERAELATNTTGTLLHALLSEQLPRYREQGFAAVTREQVRADTEAFLRTELCRTFGELRDDHGEPQLRQLCRLGELTLWRLVREFAVGTFQPVGYEVPLGRTGEPDSLPAWELPLDGGGTVRLTGSVDRADTAEIDGTRYLRVVDYKTYSKELKWGDILEGLDLQMLIYLFALTESGVFPYGDAAPAGVLYLPVKLPSLDKLPAADKLEQEQFKAMKAKGLTLSEPAVAEAMNAGDGLYFSKTADFGADREQFEVIRQYIHHRLTAMMEELRGGRIAVSPLRNAADTGACEHCDYAAVCGRDSDCPERRVRAWDTAAAWEELRRFDGAEGGEPHA